MDNPELDEPEYCLICGKDPDHTCQCPECPVCETVGDPDCLGTHVGHLPQDAPPTPEDVAKVFASPMIKTTKGETK